MKLIVTVVLALAFWPAGANAFWQRSHWAACNEASLPKERLRLNCHVYAPVHDWAMPSEPFKRPVRPRPPSRLRK